MARLDNFEENFMFNFHGSDVEKFYNGVQSIPVGVTLTFTQLADVGFDIKRNRGLIYAANKYLKEHHKKMLISDRNVGYKMAAAQEQIRHGWQHKRKAVKQITKAIHDLNHVDKKVLNDDEKKDLQDKTIFLATNIRMLRKRNIAALNISKQAATKTEQSIQMQQENLQELGGLARMIDAMRKRLK